MTEQGKREWVIEGLGFTLEESGWDANAAYDQELMIQVVTEAIALLKAQEPRVMTLEEIHGRMHVWLEYIEKNEVVLAIGGDSCGGAKCFITEYDESVALKDRQYNLRWRAWTQRPTRTQMEAVPWLSEERAGE